MKKKIFHLIAYEKLSFWGMNIIFLYSRSNLTRGHYCVKILNMGYVELGVFFINIHADGAAVKTLDLEAKIH